MRAKEPRDACDQVGVRELTLLDFPDGLLEHGLELRKAIAKFSAKTGAGLDEVVEQLVSLLPEGPFMYPPEDRTDQSVEVQLAELVAQEASGGARSRRGHVIVVFQPHLYTRTQAFADEFAAALSLADEVVVLDVYGAREKPIPGVSGAVVAQSVTKPVHYQPDMSLVARQVATLAQPGDVVITMGAGDVTMLGSQILDALRSRPHHGRPRGAV